MKKPNEPLNEPAFNSDNLEEVKELLEHSLESHSWPSVEEALLLIKEELGYDVEENVDEEE